MAGPGPEWWRTARTAAGAVALAAAAAATGLLGAGVLLASAGSRAAGSVGAGVVAVAGVLLALGYLASAVAAVRADPPGAVRAARPGWRVLRDVVLISGATLAAVLAGSAVVRSADDPAAVRAGVPLSWVAQDQTAAEPDPVQGLLSPLENPTSADGAALAADLLAVGAALTLGTVTVRRRRAGRRRAGRRRLRVGSGQQPGPAT